MQLQQKYCLDCYVEKFILCLLTHRLFVTKWKLVVSMVFRTRIATTFKQLYTNYFTIGL